MNYHKFFCISNLPAFTARNVLESRCRENEMRTIYLKMNKMAVRYVAQLWTKHRRYVSTSRISYVVVDKLINGSNKLNKVWLTLSQLLDDAITSIWQLYGLTTRKHSSISCLSLVKIKSVQLLWCWHFIKWRYAYNFCSAVWHISNIYFTMWGKKQTNLKSTKSY